MQDGETKARPSYFPKEWDDENVMNFYFAPLPSPRSTDEEEWDVKMNFWLPLIKKSLTQKDSPRLSFSLADLKTRFSRNGATSSCIEDVLCESVASRELQNINSVFTPQSVASLPWRLASAVFSYFLSSPNTLPPGRYCFVDHLRDASARLYDQVLKDCHSPIDFIVPYTTICKLSPYPDNDLDLILAQLINERKVIQLEIDNARVYKFAPRDGRALPANELDATVARLKSTLVTLALKIAAMELASNNKKEEVLSLLRTKKKKLAVYPLRLKRRYDQKLEQLYGVLSNIQETLHGMENVSTNIEIIEAMKAGSQALKQLQKTVNLEALEEVVEETRDALQENEEVEKALSEPLQDTEEMKSVEEEYQKMLFDLQQVEKEIAEKKTEAKRASSIVITDSGSLIGVPSSSSSSSSSPVKRVPIKTVTSSPEKDRMNKRVQDVGDPDHETGPTMKRLSTPNVNTNNYITRSVRAPELV